MSVAEGLILTLAGGRGQSGPMIEARNVEFKYPGNAFGLRVASLELRRGDRMAVTGASGSGKTTLLHILAGILHPQQGRVSLHGMDLSELGPEDRQDLRLLRVGLVFQGLELLEHLDVLENVLLPFRVSPYLTLDASARQRARTLVDAVGLGHRQTHAPSRLSQGERQRVALARALVTRPPVVMADEPTANLDADARDRVAELLLEHARTEEATLLVASHDPALVARFDGVIDMAELA